MRVKKISYSSKFLRNLRKLPPEVKNVIDLRLNIFKSNCFDSRLKTHKLIGAWKNYWAFSVTYSYRIVFEFTNPGDVGFVDVGNHDVYR